MNLDEVKTPFDLLDVTIAGEILAARPTEFEFENEDDETPRKATAYETTCPKCSNLVHFEATAIKANEDGQLFVQGCGDCPVPASATGEVIEESDIVEGADFDSIMNEEGFRDPIASGEMVVEGAQLIN